MNINFKNLALFSPVCMMKKKKALNSLMFEMCVCVCVCVCMCVEIWELWYEYVGKYLSDVCLPE